MTETVAGITYSKPTVVLLQETGIGTSELAARTCYDSFSASENDSVKLWSPELHDTLHLNDIEHSDLLDSLAWTHFHHSILEHANLTYLIRGTSRGVLQEHARHRIQAISVRSTRYTMSSIINAFVATIGLPEDKVMDFFCSKIAELDLFITTDNAYNVLEARSIAIKLSHQYNAMGHDAFIKLAVPNSSLHILNAPNPIPQTVFEYLEAGKKKRNVGDAFKHIVSDNWKVDMVVTMNLRALKNYLTLRDSGAAYFQIQWLAQAMKDVTPSKYLDLIVK